MKNDQAKAVSISQAVIDQLSHLRQDADSSLAKSSAAAAASEDAMGAKKAIASLLERQGVDFSIQRGNKPSWNKFVNSDSSLSSAYSNLLGAFELNDHWIRIKTAEAPTLAIPIGPDGIGKSISPYNRYLINLEASSEAKVVHGCMGSGQSAGGRIDFIQVMLGIGAKLDLTMFARSNKGAPMLRFIMVEGKRGSRCIINEGYDLSGPARQVILSSGGGLALKIRSLIVATRIEAVGAHFSYQMTAGVQLNEGRVFLRDPNSKVELDGLPFGSEMKLADSILQNFPAEYAVELRANI